jgi:asparagine synthetase A
MEDNYLDYNETVNKNIEDDICNKDTLEKLYFLFKDIEETVWNDFPYKIIKDDYNIFIMMNKDLLNLFGNLRLKKTRK